MLEQTQPQNMDTQVTQLDDFGFDKAYFDGKREAWMTTGECPGPEQIGRIELSDEALEHLQTNIGTAGMRIVMGDPKGTILDEDDEVVAHKVSVGVNPPIDPQSRHILRTLIADFRSLITQDYNSNAENSARFQDSFVRTDLRFGLYMGEDSPHIDDNPPDHQSSNNDIRYLVTVVGPTTNFYVGTGFRPDYFDESGTMKTDTSVPGSVTPTPIPQGAVVRFLEKGDPHAGPTREAPEFRIFLSATIRPR